MSSTATAPTTSATDLTSGTLADGRQSPNVPLKDAANVFTALQTISGTDLQLSAGGGTLRKVYNPWDSGAVQLKAGTSGGQTVSITVGAAGYATPGVQIDGHVGIGAAADGLYDMYVANNGILATGFTVVGGATFASGFVYPGAFNDMAIKTYNGTLDTRVIVSCTTGDVTVVAGKLLAAGGIGVGNSAAGSSLGSVVKKMQVFDASGNSLGYIPIYNAIT